MATLRAGVILFLFLAATVALIPFQWLAVLTRSRLALDIPRVYHRLVCALFGVRRTIIGTPQQGGVLIAANHTSWLDITVLGSTVPGAFVAKSDVGGWAFFGTLARLQRTIFVGRERAKALQDRDAIRDRLKEGSAVVLFPEGTSNDGNRVLPFKSALLSAAELMLEEEGVQKRVAVQPVSLAYVRLHGIPMGRENRPFFAWYGDMELVPHLWEALRTGPVDVVVEFHAPVTLDMAGSRKDLAARLERTVRDGVARALAGPQLTPGAGHHDQDAKEDFGGARPAPA